MYLIHAHRVLYVIYTLYVYVLFMRKKKSRAFLIYYGLTALFPASLVHDVMLNYLSNDIRNIVREKKNHWAEIHSFNSINIIHPSIINHMLFIHRMSWILLHCNCTKEYVECISFLAFCTFFFIFFLCLFSFRLFRFPLFFKVSEKTNSTPPPCY